MANAKRDSNRVPTLIGVSSSDGSTPINVYADPTTHRLLVDLVGVGAGDVVGPASSTNNSVAFFSGTTGKLITGNAAFTYDPSGKIFNVGFASNNYINVNDTTGISIFGGQQNNAVTLVLNDSLQKAVISLNAQDFLRIDKSNGIYGMGDFGNTSQGTVAWVSDSAQTFNVGFTTSTPLMKYTTGLGLTLTASDSLINSGDMAFSFGGEFDTTVANNIVTQSTNGNYQLYTKTDITLAAGYGGPNPSTAFTKIYNANSNFSAILDVNGLTTADRRFTFPDASGTLALTSDLITTLTDTNTVQAAVARRDTWVFPDNTINAATDIQATRFYAIKALWYEINSSGVLVQRNSASYGSNFYYTSANAALMRANATETYVTLTAGVIADIATMTANGTKRANATAALRNFCILENFTGVELDVEVFSISGGATAPQYANFKTWLTELGNDLHSYGLKLMVDVPPIWNNGTSATPPEWNGRNSSGYYTLNYADFNTLPVDYILPLAYDYQFDLGAGYPNQPITWMQAIASWARSQVTNKSKIIMGLPAAGYSGATGGYTITGRNYTYLSAQTGFGSASRDSDSQELIWANAGISYACIDETAMLAKIKGAEQYGIGRVSQWYAGGNKYSNQRFQDISPFASSSGVTTLTGTANQVIATSAIGDVTLSLPQSIATTSTPQFAKIGIGAAAGGNALYVSGSGYSGGYAVDASISPAPNANAYLANIAGTIVEAGSGTHNLLAGQFIAIQTVTGGAATVNNTASLYIDGPMTATVAGKNYALWSGGGSNRFDGLFNAAGSDLTANQFWAANSTGTAMVGVSAPIIVYHGRATAQTASVSLVSQGVPAVDTSYIISANILVTTATLHNFTCTCTYTDEGNTSRTLTLNFSTIGGVLTPTIVNTNGSIAYEGVPLHIRAKASTNIVLATTGTFTTVTYNVEGLITLIP